MRGLASAFLFPGLRFAPPWANQQSPPLGAEDIRHKEWLFQQPPSPEWRELRTNADEKTGDSRTGKTERKRGMAADLRSLRSKLGACHPLSRPACKPLKFTPFGTGGLLKKPFFVPYVFSPQRGRLLVSPVAERSEALGTGRPTLSPARGGSIRVFQQPHWQRFAAKKPIRWKPVTQIGACIPLFAEPRIRVLISYHSGESTLSTPSTSSTSAIPAPSRWQGSRVSSLLPEPEGERGQGRCLAPTRASEGRRWAGLKDRPLYYSVRVIHRQGGEPCKAPHRSLACG